MAVRANGGRRSQIPTNPIHNRIAEVLVPVADLERARAWYCALLDVPEPEPADGCARLEMQGVSLTLTSGTDERPRRLPAVVLRTEDVAATEAFLRKHGIAVTAAGDGWLTFADPDGNVLMVRGPRG